MRLLELDVTRRNIKGSGLATDMKHIPDIFKFNSREVRLKLLAGLIDIDGLHATRDGHFAFSRQSATWLFRLFL